MGRDKASLPFRGTTLSDWIACQVSKAAGSATFVGKHALGIPDLYPGEGPLGGILTALQHTEALLNLIVACDMPQLEATFLRGLIDIAAKSDADVLLPCTPSGLPEPLCAVYHRRTLGPLRARFEGGTRKITDALEGLAVVTLEVAEVAQFQNLNTPEDWAVYAGE
jgi:molybdopterin-guanine dinucleotide biosynthesis protein A